MRQSIYTDLFSVLAAETAMAAGGKRTPTCTVAGIITEASAVGSASLPRRAGDRGGCPRYDLAELGGEIGFCEGVVFKLDGETLAGVELRRIPKKD